MKLRLRKGALGFAIGTVLLIWLLAVSKGGSRGPVETWVKDVTKDQAREVLRLYGSGFYKRVVGCDDCDRFQQFGRWKRSSGHLELSPSDGGKTLKFMHMNFLGCEALVSESPVSGQPGDRLEASIYFLDPDPCSRAM